MSNPRTSLSQGFKKLQAIQPNYNWRKQFEDNLKERLVFVFPKQEGGFNFSNLFKFDFALKQGVISLVVLVLFSSCGLIYASQNSIPGGHLYALKRLTEKARMSLVLNQKQKIALRAEIISNRLGEMKELSKPGEPSDAQAKNDQAQYLATAQSDIKKEFKALKKDLLAEQSVGSSEPTATDEISLPVNDNKQIVNDSTISDLEQTMEETKQSLKENDLVSALQKTLAAENQLSNASQVTSTAEQINSSESDKTMAPTNLNNQKKYNKEIKSNDFRIDNFQRESEIQSGIMIREK